MTNEMKTMRQAYDLTPEQWAQLLSVHISSVHKWEAAEETPKLRGFQQRLYAVLAMHQDNGFAIGLEIERALAIESPLFAVYRLLRWHYRG